MAAAVEEGLVHADAGMARDFLRGYWAGGEGHVQVFAVDEHRGTRRTYWSTVDDTDTLAATAIAATEAGASTWFGVASRRHNLGQRRGGTADCLCFPAMHVDIDIFSRAHARQDLPRDRAEAHRLLDSFGVAPTVTVDSGWGLQAWWMLAEPLDLDEATSLLPRWGAGWVETARLAGVWVDNVWDAARIMRLPGTINWKIEGEPRLAHIVHADWSRRYGVDDLTAVLREPPPDPAPAPRVTTPYIGPARPGDAFNTARDCGEILAAHGWVLARTDRTGDRHYIRPGKDRRQGTGATVYADGHAAIYTSAIPSLKTGHPYDPFGLEVALVHGGDFAAATKALAAAGYGDRSVARYEPKVSTILDELDEEDDGGPLVLPPSPPVMGEAAYRGLAGQIINEIAPHTEADPAALLASFLVMFGGAIGGGPFVMASGTRHQPRLFAVIVGRSAKARKSTSFDNIADVIARADPDFVSKRVLSGFGSGEALVDAVADPDPRDSTDEPGVVDRRCLVWESEWARLLKVAARKEATLSPIVRDAWDGRSLQVRSRTKTAVARDPYVTCLANITSVECKSELSGVEIANGFANRFLLIHAERSQLLPDGDYVDDYLLERMGRAVRDRLHDARKINLMRRTPAATDVWRDMYAAMAEDEPGGVLGSLVARAEAQVLRLSMLYALLDGTGAIDVTHLESAAAVWAYARDTAAHLFWADPTEPVDPDETKLLTALRENPEGLRMRDIHDLFGRHKPLDQRRDLLRRIAPKAPKGWVLVERKVVTDGRSASTWGLMALMALMAQQRNTQTDQPPNTQKHEIHSKGPCEREGEAEEALETMMVRESDCAKSAKSAISPPTPSTLPTQPTSDTGWGLF